MMPYQKRLTDVVLRLAGDLKIRNRAQATIDAYTYHVQRFADFSKKPLDRATPQEVRNFQLHLIEDRPRPSWRELFRSTSASCPTWYARLQEAEAERFWKGPNISAQGKATRAVRALPPPWVRDPFVSGAL